VQCVCEWAILKYPRPLLHSLKRRSCPSPHMDLQNNVPGHYSKLSSSSRLYVVLADNVPGHSQISQTITVKPPSSPRPYMGSQRMSQVITVHPQSWPRPYMCLVSNIPGHSSKYPRPLPPYCNHAPDQIWVSS
jgi:hypothetical protein